VRPPGQHATADLLQQRAADIRAGSREHYDDGQLYDYEYRRRRSDVRFYRDLATELLGEQGRLLEVACGTGRITVSLLRDGHHVVGMDRSEAMLARARARVGRIGLAARARAALVRADMRCFAFQRRFPLVVMAFNSLEHLYTDEDLSACLHCVHDHLVPGGHFAFDVQNPDLSWLSPDPDRRRAKTKFRHPSTAQLTEYSSSHVYDPVAQINVIRFYYQTVVDLPEGRGPSVVRLSQRMFFPAELLALVRAHGFEIVAHYGDFRGEPLSSGSESQVLVCRRPTG